MINKPLEFALPEPWKNTTFSTKEIGAINFIVGPNGAGKSKFAETLRQNLGNARLLGTDRLSGMEQNSAFRGLVGDVLSEGFAKNRFPQYKSAGQQGLGIDTLILLEERMDLRIQVEATLTHLFDRKITLEWDSGHLVARAVRGSSGTSYRLDRDECHGIKELLVLLTHSYNHDHPYLIIDEPELNLHPQYQAFFMQEVRKLAGDPDQDKTKKLFFLVTHSPFILDFRSVEDVKSVISFNLKYSVPNQILGADADLTAKLASLVPRLNVHHKQLFFSDNPAFVEGILDAQLIGTMQEARGVSVAGAGGCIIDAGGSEEVNKYLELCLAFDKSAHFLYDLDSLFGGNLRACVKADGSVQSFLLTAGLGHDFGKYCGQLDSTLTDMIDALLALKEVPASLIRLFEFLSGLGARNTWDGKRWSRARVSVLTAISRYRTDVATITSEARVADIEARLKQISGALRQRNIGLLLGGTLERYLPAYKGDHYELSEEAKRQAVTAEIEELAKPMAEAELSARYGELYEAVRRLPSKMSVDVDRVLREYLSRYIHELQVAVTNNQGMELDALRAHLNIVQGAAKNLFSVHDLTRAQGKEFSALVTVAPMLGQGRRRVRVSNLTNAGVGDFQVEGA